MNLQTEQLNWLTLLRLNEQAIAKQSLEDKNEKIKDLQKEVSTLRDLLGGLMRTPQPQAAPQKRGQPAPRRWSVH